MVDEYRPLDVFSVEEQPRLFGGPDNCLRPADQHDGQGASGPSHRSATALYSIRGDSSAGVDVRADRQLVRVFHRGQLVKVHPRQHPRGRSTDPADLPSHATVYAMRDWTGCAAWLPATAERSAPTPPPCWDILLPWTKMRQVYALLGLVRKCAAAGVSVMSKPRASRLNRIAVCFASRCTPPSRSIAWQPRRRDVDRASATAQA